MTTLKHLITSSPAIIYLRKPHGDCRMTFISRNTQKWLGYMAWEFLDDPEFWAQHIHPEDRLRVFNNLKSLFKKGHHLHEYRFLHKDGSYRWMRDEMSLVYDEERNPVEIVGYWADVTEYKLIEEALRESKRELTIRNRIADIFLAFPDEEMYGEVLRVLLEAMRSKVGIFGYINEPGTLIVPSMTGDIWERCQVPDKSIIFPRESWSGIWGRALREKRSLYANEGLHVPAGHMAITRVLVVPILYHGEVIGLLTVADKATDYGEKDRKFMETIAGYIAPSLNAILQRDREERARKQADAGRERPLAELEAKNRELESFVYSISHDLKAPLVSLNGFSSALKKEYESHLGEKGKHYLERIQANVAHMDVLVMSLLGLSRIGKVVGPIEEIDIEALLREIRDALTVRLEAAGAELVVQEPLPTVHADRVRIRQVFDNLIDNAVKFRSAERALRIEVGCRQENGFWRFHVADNGIGIAVQYHEQIFSPFRRLHPEIEGVGIGLTLVKKIVEYHGGRVWVESPSVSPGAGREGTGVTFYFTLPIEPGVKPLSRGMP